MGVNKAYCAIHQKDIHAVDNWDLILQQRSKTKPKKKGVEMGACTTLYITLPRISRHLFLDASSEQTLPRQVRLCMTSSRIALHIYITRYIQTIEIDLVCVTDTVPFWTL